MKIPESTINSLEQRSAWTLDALNHLDQGVTVFDHELRLVAWNKRWHELLDFPAELAAENQHLEALFRFNAERGEYGDGNIDVLVAERVVLAQAFEAHVFDRIRPDGTIIEVRGNPMENGGFVTTYTDVTERRHAEARLEQRVIERTEALRDSESWIRQIADAVPALIAYLDKDNRYQFVNQMHEQWFGLESEQLLGKSIFTQVESHNLNQIRQDIRSVLQGEQVQNEYMLGHGSKRPMHVSISFIPHFDTDRRLLGYFFLGQDLTEYKQAQRELVESHKMQALGLLTGGVAHDFNNLLTIILGNLAFLAEDDIDKDEMDEAVACCQHAAKRGSNLIQRLLTFSRRQALKPKITHLNSLVEDFTSLLQRTLGEMVEVQCQLAPELRTIKVDRNQLESCLLNLALNARDAMPDGGLLLISTQAYEKQLKPASGSFGDLPTGSYIMLSVADEGEGMSAEVISRAFEPFFTTKPSGVGTGLGLSMVYGFVRQSGGAIDIISRVGHGSTIRLIFPVEDPGFKEKLKPESVELNSEESARILLVEDDEGVRQYVYRSLCKMGYQVEQAENGEAAMEQLHQKPGYDLVLTDIVMPGAVNGLDIYRCIQQDYPQTRVLCMTGYSDHPDHELDESCLLRKPFQSHQLSAKVLELLHADHV